MDKVTSKDGTPIAYRRSGTGPALLLIPGITWLNRWDVVLPRLEPRFTVYQMTRRGRGESGDSVDYSLEREVEDVMAVIEMINGPVDVLAHSFGALCALEATLLQPRVRKLILYEPPLSLHGPASLQPAIDKMQAALDAGDRERVWDMYVRNVSVLPEQEIERQRAQPEQAIRLASIHTTVREVRAVNEYTFVPSRFSAITIPTLFLLGSESSSMMKAATEAIHGALPNGRIAILPGQKHFAMDTAPDLFAHEVTLFLTNSV